MLNLIIILSVIPDSVEIPKGQIKNLFFFMTQIHLVLNEILVDPGVIDVTLEQNTVQPSVPQNRFPVISLILAHQNLVAFPGNTAAQGKSR